MIRSIIDKILPDILNLNFAEQVAGVVTPASQHVLNIDNNPITKIFPIYPNDPTTCKGGDYITLVPDEKYRSVIYFEEISNQLLEQTNYFIHNQTTVRLIGWFNLKKIGNSATSDYLLSQIMQVVNNNAIADFNNLYQINVTFDGIENKSPQLFSSYTYDEAEQQYLLFPYDYGALRYVIDYRINICSPPQPLRPNCGKRP